MSDRSFEELGDLLALCDVKGIGAARLTALVEAFGSPGAVLAASPSELETVEGIPSAIALAIVDAGRSRTDGGRDSIMRQCERIFRTNTSVIACVDADYPPHLLETDDPPQLLFAQGDTGLLAVPGVAVVGTRRPSEYGRQITEAIAATLVRHGMTVISGMARGVDSIAHTVALDRDGLTIAALGCGVDVVYPPEARNLHARIREQGLLVSEVWLGAAPDRINFPRRNRIISGLSRAVIVTEAPRASGALITADVALRQGRDVYAVPADITRREAAGANGLIADGARVVRDMDDLVISLGLGTRVPTPEGDQLGLPVSAPADLSPEERAVLDALPLEPVHVDVLAVKLGRKSEELLTSLTLMEMRGLAVAHAGSRFSRATMTG